MGNDEPDMVSLTSPRRPDATDRHRLVLEASEAVRDDDRTDVDPVSWPVAAVWAGLATAAVGWSGQRPGRLRLADGRRRRAVGGARARHPAVAARRRRPRDVGGLEVSLVPWGLTVSPPDPVALRRLRRAPGPAPRQPDGTVRGRRPSSPSRTWRPCSSPPGFFGEPWRAPGRWAVIVLVLLVAAWAGAGSRVGRPSGRPGPRC